MFEKIFDFISKYEILKYDWFEYIRYLNNELVYLESFQEKDFFFYYLLYFYDKFIHYTYNSFWIKKDLSLWFDWANQLILDYFLEPFSIFLGVFLWSFIIFWIWVLLKKILENKLVISIFKKFNFILFWLVLNILFIISIWCLSFISFVDDKNLLKDIFHYSFNTSIYLSLAYLLINYKHKFIKHISNNLVFYWVLPRILPIWWFMANFFIAFSNKKFLEKIFYLFYSSIFTIIFIYIYKYSYKTYLFWELKEFSQIIFFIIFSIIYLFSLKLEWKKSTCK